MVPGMGHPCRGDPRFSSLLRTHRHSPHGRRPTRHIRDHDKGRVRQGLHLEHCAERRNAALHLGRRHAGVQNEVLEHRSRGTGAHQRPCHGNVYALHRQVGPHMAPVRDNDRRKHSRRHHLGGHSRSVQGILEHQRNALHPDDELRCHSARRILPQGGRQERFEHRRSHAADRGVVPLSVR